MEPGTETETETQIRQLLCLGEVMGASSCLEFEVGLK